MTKPKIKIIQLSDTYQDNKYKFPYFQCINSKLCFLLRSKITYGYEPIILIQNDKDIRTLLPFTEQIRLDSEQINSNFDIVHGYFREDGGWMADLSCESPGLVSFQLCFLKRGEQNVISKFGSCDSIIVMQNKVDIRFLRKQSVFPRCIGHHSKWVDFFKSQMELGYNSFHLAPIQQTGISKSYYSLHDQLDLSSDVFEGTSEQKMTQLKNIIAQLKKQNAVFFIDIVLNHTSFDSDWIKSNPNAVYTSQNTPLLESAYQVDKAIFEWGNQIKEIMSAVEERMTQQEFLCHKQKLWGRITALKLEDYFRVPEDIINKFQEIVPPSKPSENLFAKDPIEVIEDFLNENVKGLGSSKKGVQVRHLQTKWRNLQLAYESVDLRKGIELFNKRWRTKIQNEWVPQIVNNVMGQVRWNYLQDQSRSYKDNYPFVKKYFTEIVSPKGQNFFALNNGWVSGMETSVNFIYSEQFYYMRRRVHVWGDLVRIRYGQKPEDSPCSWRHMSEYVKSMAKVFDGFRMDNLHGTQRHVAKYMIKEARKMNPNLIVFAELFTDTEQEKAMFVREIGVNSTLKQAQHMLNGDSFLRTFHQIMGPSGPYIGSLNPYFETQTECVKYCRRKRPIILIYDLTHDNQSYVKKGMILKQLPIALLCSFAGTFIGSTKGFDQFYNKHILVTEQAALYAQDKLTEPLVDNSGVVKKRFIFTGGSKHCELFGSWNNWKQGLVMTYDEQISKYWVDLELPPGKYEYKFKGDDKWVNEGNQNVNSNFNHEFQLPKGLVRTVYPNLEGFRKVTTKQIEKFKCYRQYYAHNDKDIVILTRQTQDHLKSITVIANLSNEPQKINTAIRLPGQFVSADVWYQTGFAVSKGISTEVQIVHHNNILEFFEIKHLCCEQKDELVGTVLPAGFGCVVQTQKSKRISQTIMSVNQILEKQIKLQPMGALDYNLLLFGIAREEQIRFGQSNYVLPNNHQLIYAGFAGIYQMVKNAKKHNNLSSNLFDNLRQGRWLLHYYVRRIKRFKNLSEVADIIQRYFSAIEGLPAQLIPKYFSDFVMKLWCRIEYTLCDSNNQFERKLCLATTQFISHFPNEKQNFQTTISAGLPHFATGWSRSWGRDTFISNQLLLKHPNIYRDVILQFASAMRHGLIPNLLDSGNNPRYNCRDACWWFIRGVKQYALHTGDYQIFKSKVTMLFNSNDLLQHNKLKSQGNKRIMILQDIIQNIFQSHADGISYREWHSGYQIDANMNTEGFNVNLQADEQTGFIVGGNQYNCLTWMDKMGSSSKAGTKGIPATPRAGAPVDMVAILKHCLSSYNELYKSGHYSFNKVNFKNQEVTFQKWASRIQSHFQPFFYIPHNNDKHQAHYSIKSSMVRVRGMYKDVVFSPIESEEYRLRPNVLVAMSLAPQLFTKEHALSYLSLVKHHLLHDKSIGVATLSPIHESLYSPYYDNDDDSDIVRLAHGFSYHNGPEWVWLYGFYIKALIKFKGERLKKQQVMGLVQEHFKTIENHDWVGLPELTNKNGDYCHFSCSTQAWSISSLIMALEEIKKMPN